MDIEKIAADAASEILDTLRGITKPVSELSKDIQTDLERNISVTITECIKFEIEHGVK